MKQKVCILASLLISTALLTSACKSGPYFSAGAPKVYNDGQTRALMDALYKKKNEKDILPSPKEECTQNISDISQTSSFKQAFAISNASFTQSITLDSDSANHQQNLLTAKQQAGNMTSLGFTPLLRERIRRLQDLSRYDMLYLGDQNFVNEKKHLFLLRMDLAVLLTGSCYGDGMEYAIANFEILNGESPFSPDNVEVYALAPEYSSVVSKDSLLSLSMGELNAQAGITYGSISAKGATDIQKQIEEYFASTNEAPVQFTIPRGAASPGNSAARYSVAFGPQRHIYKRGWMNPRRWFGDTYVISYDFVPVTADVYALMVVDDSVFKGADEAKITVKATAQNGLRGLSLGVGLNDKDEIDEIGTFQLTLRRTARQDKTEENKAKAIPEIISRGAETSVLIDTTPFPVTSGTRLIVNGNPIDNSRLRVRGMHLLEVTLPALTPVNADSDKAQSDSSTPAKANPQPDNIVAVITTPGVGGYSKIANLQFAPGDKPTTASAQKPESDATANPAKSAAK